MAKASNVRLNVGDPIEHIRKLGGKIPDARPSMLLDYNAGRRCEVDAINGAIPRLGKPLGVTTRYSDRAEAKPRPYANIWGRFACAPPIFYADKKATAAA